MYDAMSLVKINLRSGFVLPFSIIVPAAILIILIGGYYAIRAFSKKAPASSAAVQTAVDPALAARLAAAQALVKSQTAALDRMLVESQAQQDYGTILVDAYGTVNDAAEKTQALSNPLAARQPAVPPAGAAVQQSIAAVSKQIADALASWKAALAQYDAAQISLNDLAADAKKDAAAIQGYVQQLADIVGGLTPSDSGLPQSQIDAYKAEAKDASQAANAVIDSMVPFEQAADGQGPGGNPGSGGTGPGTPVTQQDINAQIDAVAQAKADADAIQKQIDQAAQQPADSGGSNGTGNADGSQDQSADGQNGTPDDGSVDSQGNPIQQDQSSAPKLIEGANKY